MSAADFPDALDALASAARSLAHEARQRREQRDPLTLHERTQALARLAPLVEQVRVDAGIGEAQLRAIDEHVRTGRELRRATEAA